VVTVTVVTVVTVLTAVGGSMGWAVG